MRYGTITHGMDEPDLDYDDQFMIFRNTGVRLNEGNIIDIKYSLIHENSWRFRQNTTAIEIQVMPECAQSCQIECL